MKLLERITNLSNPRTVCPRDFPKPAEIHLPDPPLDRLFDRLNHVELMEHLRQLVCQINDVLKFVFFKLSYSAYGVDRGKRVAWVLVTKDRLGLLRLVGQLRDPTVVGGLLPCSLRLGLTLLLSQDKFELLLVLSGHFVFIFFLSENLNE